MPLIAWREGQFGRIIIVLMVPYMTWVLLLSNKLSAWLPEQNGGRDKREYNMDLLELQNPTY